MRAWLGFRLMRLGYWILPASAKRTMDRMCGDSAYSVRITGPDGAVLYDDDEWDGPRTNRE